MVSNMLCLNEVRIYQSPTLLLPRDYLSASFGKSMCISNNDNAIGTEHVPSKAETWALQLHT